MATLFKAYSAPSFTGNWSSSGPASAVVYTAPANKFAFAFINRITFQQGGTTSYLQNSVFTIHRAGFYTATNTGSDFTKHNGVFIQPGASLIAGATGFSQYSWCVYEFNKGINL